MNPILTLIDNWTSIETERSLVGLPKFSLNLWKTLSLATCNCMVRRCYCWTNTTFFFEEGGVRVTIDSKYYLHMLNKFFLPELQAQQMNCSSVYFHPEGATVSAHCQRIRGDCENNFSIDANFCLVDHQTCHLETLSFGVIWKTIYIKKPQT